jgi:hypothetical protein
MASRFTFSRIERLAQKSGLGCPNFAQSLSATALNSLWLFRKKGQLAQGSEQASALAASAI